MNAFDTMTKDPLEAEFDREIALRDRQDQQRADEHSVTYVPVVEEAGRLASPEALRRFILAGKAIFTVVSRKTGTRFTFKASRPEIDQANPNAKRPTWVSVLSGSDNSGDYAFMGTLWEDAQWGFTFRTSAKARVGNDAPSRKAFDWIVKGLSSNQEKLFQAAEFWHEGRCGRCGRRLTVPSSIASGFGPECEGKA